MTTPASSEPANSIAPILLRPDWHLPSGIFAAVSTRRLVNDSALPVLRTGGMGHFNLATHVGDDVDKVRANRESLQQSLELPAPVAWLNQVHGIDVFLLSEPMSGPRSADASVSIGSSAAVCAVLTADCLPILLCNQSGSAISAVHAGWRGLLAGVIEAAIKAMASVEPISAYVGPAIGAQAFEVGAEVYEAFVAHDRRNAEFFLATANGNYLGDLAAMARARLLRAGVTDVVLSGRCTFQESSIFYSHRAGQGSVGRFASLIWRNSAAK